MTYREWYKKFVEKGKLDIEEKALRNKGGDFDVDWTVIKSKGYTNRFNQLSDNDKANQLAAKRARNMLVNRDGKETEEIYAISLTTGKDVSKIIDQHYIRGVKMTQKFMDDIKRAEDKGEKILLLHNHPSNSIPSLADLNELKSHENVVGITIGHKGSIYYYTKPNNEIRQMDLNIALLKKSRYNYDMRMAESMKYLAKEFDFDFKIL